MAKASRSKEHDSKVGDVMHEFKEGTLESSSGQKVRSRKQAIAIGLSEAREAGEDVPPPPKKSSGKNASTSRKSTARTATPKKAAVKKSAPKKSVSTKNTAKKSVPKKAAVRK